MLKFDKTADDLIERLKGNPDDEPNSERIVIWARQDRGVVYLYYSCIHNQEDIPPVHTLCRNSEGEEWSWETDSLDDFRDAFGDSETLHIYDASINDIIFQTLTGE